MQLGRDNRCLKPNDMKDSETWDHYDPDDFYEATSEEFIILLFALNEKLFNINNISRMLEFGYIYIFYQCSKESGVCS